MPRVSEQLLSRSRLNPGRTEATQDLTVNKSGLTVTLDPNVADFDDPALRVTMETLCSFDGGQTYPVTFTTTFVGGARTKGGGMPFKQYPRSMTIKGEEVVFTHAKTSLVLSDTCRMGLTASTDRD